MKRRFPGILVLLGLVGLVAVPYLIPETPGPTAANFRALYKGLSEQRVHELLGPPLASRAEPNEKAVHHMWRAEAECIIGILTIDDKVASGTMFSPGGNNDIVECIAEDPGLLWRLWRSVRF